MAPTLTPGEELILLARYKEADAFTVSISSPKGKTLSQTFQLPEARSRHLFVPRMWARMRLSQLLQQEQDAQTVAEIGNLSQEFTLMTPYTSFLVLENEAAYRQYGIERMKRRRYWRQMDLLKSSPPEGALPPPGREDGPALARDENRTGRNLKAPLSFDLTEKDDPQPPVRHEEGSAMARVSKKTGLNPDVPLSFAFPGLDREMKEVEEESLHAYVADRMGSAEGGKMGVGGKGQGGWPDRMPNHVIRFIRLEYSGSAWNDGMDMRTRADLNFLEEFRKQTGFKIARKGESHPINHLSKYPKGYAPPFVYMTGSGGIKTSAEERLALRAYLLGGGMLFADCGGPGWDFRAFIQSVLPEYSLIDIADDDPIYRQPHIFPNGAPSLWHHDGYRALGMRHGNRLMVFYHPGDLNDAWKTGRSGLSADQAESAFNMGINVLYYAFTRYLEQTRNFRREESDRPPSLTIPTRKSGGNGVSAGSGQHITDLVQAYRSSGRPTAEILRAWSGRLEESPNDFSALWALAEGYKRLEKNRQAVYWLRRAAPRAPAENDTYASVAGLALDLGQINIAMDVMRQMFKGYRERHEWDVPSWVDEVLGRLPAGPDRDDMRKELKSYREKKEEEFERLFRE